MSVWQHADLVVYQTGCISHNAYWRVKDFCKCTGKRCVFVERAPTCRRWLVGWSRLGQFQSAIGWQETFAAAGSVRGRGEYRPFGR